MVTPAFARMPKMLWKARSSVAVVSNSDPPKLMETMFRFETVARSVDNWVSPATISPSLSSGMS